MLHILPMAQRDLWYHWYHTIDEIFPLKAVPESRLLPPSFAFDFRKSSRSASKEPGRLARLFGNSRARCWIACENSLSLFKVPGKPCSVCFCKEDDIVVKVEDTLLKKDRGLFEDADYNKYSSVHSFNPQSFLYLGWSFWEKAVRRAVDGRVTQKTPQTVTVNRRATGGQTLAFIGRSYITVCLVGGPELHYSDQNGSLWAIRAFIHPSFLLHSCRYRTWIELCITATEQ